MIPAPVIASTISPQYLENFIIPKYGLDKGATCELLRTGMNHTYMVKSQENRYILRVYSFNWRSKGEIQEELDLLVELFSMGIPISYPITNVDKGFLNELTAPEGLRYLVLFSYAEGKKVRYLDVDVCQKIGALMATIHKAVRDKSIQRIDYSYNTLLEKSYQKASTFFDSSIETMKSLHQTNRTVANKLKETNLFDVRKGIVHLDIWYDNMAISKDGEITIFDFDFCGNGLLITDVAYFLKQLFHIEPDKNRYEKLKKAFVDGYSKKIPMQSQELELIPYLGWSVFMFYLGIQTERFDWSNIFLSENYLKMYVGRMKSWLAYHEIS